MDTLVTSRYIVSF